MKSLCFLSLLAFFLIRLPSLAQAADTKRSDYRETPDPFRLFLNQWTREPPPPTGYTLDFLRTADEQTSEVRLEEAILIGLKNNPGIQVNRLEPLRAAEEIMLAKSIFDPTLSFEFHKNFSVDPSGRASSSFFQPIQISRNRDYNLSLAKLLRTGTQLEISFLNNRFRSSLPNQVLDPQYRPHLGISFVQPLLRDFGLGLTTIFVRIAENRENISVFDYRARLAELVQRITEAYWAVVFARDNVGVQRKGVELAEALLKGAEARVRTGVLPQVAVLEAQAEKARREELVIIAENELEIARTNLRLTLNLNPQNTFMPRRIEPVEDPSVAPFEIDRVRSRERALTERPEIQAVALDVQNQALQLRFSQNQLLPRLDLRAGAGLTGIAGRLRPGETNPFPGDYGTAIDRLGRGDFYDYSVGVVLEFPLGNGQARSNYAIAGIQLDQAKARQRDLVSRVTQEVERTVGDVEANFKRIQTTRLSREFAEENLRGQEKRLQVGLVTQRDVIDFQTRFLEAQVAELRAVIDYNSALSRLRLSEGSLLNHYNIKVEGPEKQRDPWWAKF